MSEINGALDCADPAPLLAQRDRVIRLFFLGGFLAAFLGGLRCADRAIAFLGFGFQHVRFLFLAGSRNDYPGICERRLFRAGDQVFAAALRRISSRVALPKRRSASRTRPSGRVSDSPCTSTVSQPPGASQAAARSRPAWARPAP